MAFPLWLTKLLVRTRLARFTPRARKLTDGGAAFLRYYSNRVLAAPVEELLDPAIVPDQPGPDVIDLNLPAPTLVSTMSLGRLTTPRWGMAPAKGMAELRQAVAARSQRLDGRTLDPDTDIHITRGATGAYSAALDAFVNPGDRVVLFDPCSPLFALGAKSRRARIRWVATRSEDGRCRFETRDFEQAMRGAKLLVLADPGNPTGACLTEEDHEYMAWIAAAYDVLVYVDESFGRFRDAPQGKSLAALPAAALRTLTAGSVTHEFGLGSLRVGWVMGPRHLVKVCGLMANLQSPFVPEVCQQAAARALSEPDTMFEKMWDRLRGKRSYALERLKGMGLACDCPGGGYFLWVPVTGLGMDGRTFAERLYRDYQVQVGPGCAFGPSGTGRVRISLAADDGRLREGLARMASFIEGMKEKPQVSANPDTEVEVQESVAEIATHPKPSFSRV